MKRVRSDRWSVLLFAALACLAFGTRSAGSGAVASSHPKPADAGVLDSRIDPVLRQEIRQFRRDSAYSPRRDFNPATVRPDGSPLPVADDGYRVPEGTTLLACWVQFRGDTRVPRSEFRLRELGAGLFTAHLSLSEIDQLLADPGVVRIEAAQDAHSNLDVSRYEINAPFVQEGSGAPPSYSGFAGDGVVIGIVDTGLDLSHPDFLGDGSTRVEWAWDQTSATRTPPATFGYGNEWTASQIDAAITSSVMPFSDTNGHGTHVAGIAAGSGAATSEGKPAYQYVGMAPEARLVVVKTSFLTSAIVDAVAYVFEKAEAMGLPAVVNLSLGHHYGPHDGTELTDLAIDSLVGPNRLVVAAAGNEQELPIHAELGVGTGAFGSITLEIPPYAPRGGSSNDYLRLDGYYTASEIVNVSVQSPSGALYGPVVAGSQATYATEEGTIVLENDVYDPVTEDKNVFIQLHDGVASDPPAAGTWTLYFHHVSPRAARLAEPQPRTTAQVDLWLYSHTLTEAPGFVAGMTPSKLVGSPATADSVIAVAAYVTKSSWPSVDGHSYGYSPAPVRGSLAPFSSHGPRRDGVSKPDVAAPGMGVVSASSGAASVPHAWIAPDGRHMLTQGTSMAAPHVTGVIALMMQAEGSLSAREALARLQETARADASTGQTPNSGWGAGKLDALGATSSAPALVFSEPQIERNASGVRLQWTVSKPLDPTYFEVSRRMDGGQEETIATVGPGPDYILTDTAPWDSGDLVYWLTALDSSDQGSRRYGPFAASWSGPRPTFAVSAPAPNPFLSTMRFSTVLPEAGRLDIEIFDASGRRVRRLLETSLPAGSHEVSWSGRDDEGEPAPAGIYFVRARWKGATVTRRVLRLRQ